MANASQETQMLNALKDYEVGLYSNIQTAKQNGGILDPVSMQVLQGAAQSVPGAAQAYQLANAAYNGLVQLTGTGSLPSRLAKAAFSGNVITNPINVLETIFNGRTFNTDNYLGASDYSFYVLGKDLGQSTNVPDSLVPVAMKWFIDKLGIFVSGRAHINQLRNSVNAYISMVAQNPLTDTDVSRVTAARNVLLQYMPSNNIAGYWANTVGVYDPELIQLAQQGYTNYQSDLQALKQQATGSTTPQAQQTLSTLQSVFSSSNNSGIIIVIIIIIAIIFLIVSNEI